MINLIPPEGRKAIKREYLLRVWSVVLILFGGIGILIMVSLIPTYVLITSQLHAFSLEEKQATEKNSTMSDSEKELKLTTSLLAQLKIPTPKVLASDAIAEIQKRTPGNIIFETFIVDDAQGVINKITVQGKAPTREALAQLKSAIEASDMFETVEVPISDLAHDTNLPFTIGITLTHPKK